jgi:metal-dependent amidase/aminoacylase/carboxypeptidase family protein
MQCIAKNTARAFRATAKVIYEGGCPTLVNDGGASAIAEKTAVKILGKPRVATSNELGGDVRKNSGGSEDFAYISHAVPSVMIGLVAGTQEDGYQYPLHHPKVQFDEGVLFEGVALLVGVAFALLDSVGKLT